MQIKSVLNYLGIFLFISGIISVLPIPVALYYAEDYTPYLVSSIPTIFVGFFLSRLKRKDLDFADAMLLSALSLIVLSFFGALFYFITFDRTPIEVLVDGYFESVSGYTTTGFTMLPAHQLNPTDVYYNHSLIFKRSLTQWIGGVGIIALFLSVLVGRGMSTLYLYRSTKGTERISPSVESTAKIITKITCFSL